VYILSKTTLLPARKQLVCGAFTKTHPLALFTPLLLQAQTSHRVYHFDVIIWQRSETVKVITLSDAHARTHTQTRTHAHSHTHHLLFPSCALDDLARTVLTPTGQVHAFRVWWQLSWAPIANTRRLELFNCLWAALLPALPCVRCPVDSSARTVHRQQLH